MQFLEIRPEQMDALRLSALHPVRVKYIALLRQKLPGFSAQRTDDDLHGLCDRGIISANAYGVTTEYNVYCFIAARLVLGEDFDLNPKTGWSQEILRDKRMEQDVKIKLIELRVMIDTRTDISPHGR
jgi:hypothetical protein